MISEKSSYRQIFKTTSLFGGVQIFNIIISILRSKIIAVLIGPAGMGIAGLFNSTINLISSLTSFGLGTSAVKNIAASAATNDYRQVSRVMSVLKKLVWLTGLAGLVITILFSRRLSELTFGNTNYSIAFIWLSITLLFQQLTSGQYVILQGLQKFRQLAIANLLGSSIGLIIALPVYYFWRLDGIVPIIILSSLSSFILSWCFSRKVEISKSKISLKEAFIEGKEMLKMGLIISISGIITIAVSFIVRIFINNVGGVEQVGLYNAGFAIINTYVGMIFTAMGTDYYPRLSSLSGNNEKCKELINHQAEIAILILAPILTVFIVFIKWVILLLYSERFIPINEMIHWAALGMFFKAASWPVGFLLIAKGESKIFFFSELFANVYILTFNILGYKLFGLNGLGISFLITYIFVFIQVFLITKIKYAFSFNKAFLKIVGIQFILASFCFVIIRQWDSIYSYLISCVFVLSSSWYSFLELQKRLEFKGKLFNYFNCTKKEIEN